MHYGVEASRERTIAHNASVCGHVTVLKEVSEEKCEGSGQYTFSLRSSARKILVLYFPPVMDIPTRGKKQVSGIAKAPMVCLWVRHVAMCSRVKCICTQNMQSSLHCSLHHLQLPVVCETESTTPRQYKENNTHLLPQKHVGMYRLDVRLDVSIIYVIQ